MTPAGLPHWLVKLEKLEKGLFFVFLAGKPEKHLLLINILAGKLEIFSQEYNFSPYSAKGVKFVNRPNIEIE